VTSIYNPLSTRLEYRSSAGRNALISLSVKLILSLQTQKQV